MTSASDHGAGLRVALVGPTCPERGGLAAHTTALAHQLQEAGHDVALVSWGRPYPALLHARGAGRAVKDADIVAVVHTATAVVPAHLALIRAARRAGTHARIAGVVHEILPRDSSPRDRWLMQRFVGSLDAVLVHTAAQAAVAEDLGAHQVSIADLPPDLPGDTPAAGLTGPWARYVAAIETIAATGTTGAEDPAAEDTADKGRSPLRTFLKDSGDVLASGASLASSLTHRHVDLTSRDLPEWVRPTDVLTAKVEADEVVSLARDLGLPRARGPIAAWAALGALAAVLRVRDGERRSSVIVDPSGPRSVFSRWARAIGYAPVALDATGSDIASGSLDVIARLHPQGCSSEDIDAVIGDASRVLGRGGLLTVTVPVGGSDASAAILPADLRALVARADSIGMALVGDLDRDIGPLLGSLHRRIETDRPGASTAYALVRLTLRRR